MNGDQELRRVHDPDRDRRHVWSRAARGAGGCARADTSAWVTPPAAVSAGRCLARVTPGQPRWLAGVLELRYRRGAEAQTAAELPQELAVQALQVKPEETPAAAWRSTSRGMAGSLAPLPLTNRAAGCVPVPNRCAADVFAGICRYLLTLTTLER